jgi:type I restriction enzyme S subunit
MKWNKVKLLDVCDFQGGTQPPKSEWSTEPQDGYVRMLQIRDFTQGKEAFVEYVKNRHTLKKCTSEDILVGRYGASIGKILTGLSGAYNVALVKTVPTERINKRYLYFYLLSSSFQNFIQNAGSRAAQAGFNKDELQQLEVPLPPLHIQEQIADTLDKADGLRRKDQELLQKYDELAEAIFNDMFGDPVKNEKGWEMRSLKDLCHKITDGTHFSPIPRDKGIPYITAKHLKSHGLDFFSNPTYVDQSAHAEIYARCTPEKGDVLYIKDGATTGLAAVNTYDFEFSMLSSLALIKPNRSILNNYFLKYWLNNPAVKSKYLSEFMAGAAIQRFTLNKINQFPVNVPPIGLQNTFSDLVSKVYLGQDVINREKEMSDNLFHGILKTLLKN